MSTGKYLRMKKWILLFAVHLLLLTVSCSKTIIASGTPYCIKKYIEENKDKDNWYVGSVEEFRYQGKLVYAFNPDNKIIADGSTFIKTGECNSLCSVGGYGGPAINLCNGDNWFQQAELVRVIWEK